MRARNILVRSLLALAFSLSAASSLAQNPSPVNVPTWRYDTTHAGENTQELALTPTSVNPGSFGKLFSLAVDGYVYAQPLYVSGLTMSDGLVHNVLFVATGHDSLYAFDADTNGGANAQPIWHASLFSPAYGAAQGSTTVPNSDVGTADVVPEIGIIGTPAINLATNTLYVVSKTKESGIYVQRLHAINLITGAEQPNSPTVIQAALAGTGNGSTGGQLAFSPLWQMNRSALDYYNGHVYISFGSHGDNGPWHGWVMAYDATTLAQTAVLCLSANGFGNGVWAAGGGMPIDSGGTAGRMYLATGNGTYSAYPPLSASGSFGDSLVQLDLSNGGLTPTDAFTPFNQATLSSSDMDQGAGGILIPPDQQGSFPHILIQAGKEGRILLLNRDKMGGYLPGGTYNANALQDIAGQTDGLWSTPAYWNGSVYVWGKGDTAKQFALNNGVLSTTSTSASSVTSAFPGASFVISSDGEQNGIAWAARTDAYTTNGSEVLYAFDATNLATTLYESDTNARDDAGPANKFVVPVVTNGKVYLGAAYQVDVYGLLAGAPLAAAPLITPNGGDFAAGQNVTLTTATPSANIYYTLDGSIPTSASPLYTAPIPLQADLVLRAIASASGYLQSAVSTASFSFGQQTPPVTFSPAAGTYNAAQQVALSTTDSSAMIYYTVDGSTPTAASARYTGPVTVSATTIVNALAVDPALLPSNTATAAYVIQAGAASINFGNGFASVQGLTLNGSAVNKDDSRLQLTTGALNQAGSMFYSQPVNVQTFTSDFAFQLSSAQADGFTFTIQNVGPTALGSSGGYLGYAGQAPNPGITNSVAIKFDFYNNAGEGADSTGVYTDGAMPTVPAVNIASSGIRLSSGDSIQAHLTYDGTNLSMTLTDPVTADTYTLTQAINIPQIIGANKAYVGFTAGTGGLSASQKILSWTYASQPMATPTAAPFFSPAAGSYQATQTVSLTSSTPGAVIHFTTDGTTVNANSTIYTAPILVGAGTTTMQALATASGFSQSAISSAVYVVKLASTSSPTFSLAPGNYTAAQTVTLADVTPGAVIYYTTNGTIPTSTSPVYTGAISIGAGTTTVQAMAMATGLSPSTISSVTYVVTPGAAAAPTMTPAGGNYPAAQTVSLADSTPGAVIHYTTNGTTPTATSPTYMGPISVGVGTTSLQALTTATGFSSSPVSTATYVIAAGAAASPTFSPAGGSFTTAQTVALADSTPGAVIHYTTNGSAPTATSPTYTGPISVAAGTTTVQALATATGFSSSPVSTATYVVTPGTAASPTFSPAGGSYTTAQTVALADSTPGAVIHYTTNGTTPTATSPNYTGPIAVAAGTTKVQALTTATGYSQSPVSMATYVVTPGTAATPTFSPAGGSYTTAQTVALADSTPGAVIHYTTNGTTPTASSPNYTGPISVAAGTTKVQALATATGFSQSPVSMATYVVTPATAAPPTFSPAPGTYTTAQTITVTDSTPSAVIHYTTDGTTPTASSPTYTGPGAVTAGTTTLKALATASGFSQSAVITATYVVTPALTAAPTFSPAAGTYTTAQSVTLADSTAGAVIYYTTNGSAPTTASPVYAGPVQVATTETLNALAVAPGAQPSTPATSAYTIQAASGSTINYGSGFSSAQGLTLNGSAAVANTALQITNGGQNQAGSVFYSQPMNVQAFTTDFTFQLTNAQAEGFTFTIQNAGLKALGSSGAYLGYAGQSPNPGITRSAAVKFDFYNDAGEGSDSSGFYINGAVPTVPASSIAATGIQLNSGDTMHAHFSYDGSNLSMTLTDTVTGKSFTVSIAGNIPQIVGANTAYVGFTGSTGSLTATQKILNWTFSSGSAAAAAAPRAQVRSQSTQPAHSDESAPATASANNPLPTGIAQANAVTLEPASAAAAAHASGKNDAASMPAVESLVAQEPRLTPTPGSLPGETQIQLIAGAADAEIRYTVDGSQPTSASPTYRAPIIVSGTSLTVKAFCSRPGYRDSAVITGTYYVQE